MHHMLLMSMLPACVYEPVGPRFVCLHKNVLCACECVTLVVSCMFSARLNLCLYVCVKVQYVCISRGSKQSETCSLPLINTKSRENIMTHSERTQTHPSVSDPRSSSIQQCLLIGDYPSDECQLVIERLSFVSAATTHVHLSLSAHFTRVYWLFAIRVRFSLIVI